MSERDEIAAYFFEQVIAPYKEFVGQLAKPEAGERRDLRAGLNAAIAISHLREHLPPDCEVGFDELLTRCPDCGLVRDVGDIAKHQSLDRKSAILRDSSNIEEAIVLTLLTDDLGEYRHTEKVVDLRLPDGTTRDLADVLTNAINFWATYLHEKGVLVQKPPTYAAPSTKHPIARAEASQVGPALTIVKGLRFNVIFRVQRFNIESGSLEPLDLTDSNVKLTIRQPETHVGQISVRNDQDGAEFKRELVLTEEEAARAALLESDDERAHFIQELPSTKAALAAVLEELRAYRRGVEEGSES